MKYIMRSLRCCAVLFSWVFFGVIFAAPPAARVTRSALEVDWTVLIYAQANNSLSSFANKNFNDIAAVGPSSNANILVQWYKPGETGTFRYKIEKGRLDLIQSIPMPTDGNSASDLVNAMRWAVSSYPAKKYCLVLWNHGIGILDPTWGNSVTMISPRFIRDNPRIQIAGVTEAGGSDFDVNFDAMSTLEAENLIDSEIFRNTELRGILFNERSRTYMTNQNLSQALLAIKTDVLMNRKIDVLGMDACLMAMVEVGYQVKDYADYFVASQEVELAYGWNYKSVLQSIGLQKLTPLQAAQSIVVAYEELYKKQIQFYTQSAVNLANINLLKISIDNAVRDMNVCCDIDFHGFTQVIKMARSKCISFSTPTYIDAYSFFQEVGNFILTTYEKSDSVRHNSKLIGAVDKLKKSLKTVQAVIEDTVVAHTAGKFYTKAKGLSIYYPSRAISKSYASTDFARDSLWYDFLQKAVYW